MDTYKITKYKKRGKNKIIKTGLSLLEAIEFCSDDAFNGDGNVYGYTKELPVITHVGILRGT